MVKWMLLAAAFAVVSLAIASHRAEARRIARVEHAIAASPSEETFDARTVEELPDVARRYFHHAIQPGTRLAGSVTLQQFASMRPSENAARLELRAEQWLTPGRGFLWRAATKIGPLPIAVVDHYEAQEGAVRVRALGVLPIQTALGDDVTRSSRHRLAAESVWLPASLLPRTGARWEQAGPDVARVTLDIDGDVIELSLRVADDGALHSVSLARHGDVGVESWRPIPYGFAVEEERTFEGFTIPTRLRGGWWFGTDRYDPADAGLFVIESAEFR